MVAGIRRWGIVALVLVTCIAGGAALAEASPNAYAAAMSGEEILWIEERLSALGYLAAADGVYDGDTSLALQSFQLANELESTGEPDDVTRMKLREEDAVSRQAYLQNYKDSYQLRTPLQNGDFGTQIQVIQQKLIDNGYLSGTVDGVFNDATQAAMERFQMVNGLPVTGVADGMTMMRLLADTPITWQGFLSEMSAAPGDMGLNVYVLQRKLAEMGYFKGDCTGSFSDLTQQAVIQFQTDNGVEATGSADAATWALIYSGDAVTRRRADVIKLGDTGEHVMRIQERLIALGYLTGEAGQNYDYATETAVRLFQMAHGLSSTGEVDGLTLSHLAGAAAQPMGADAVQQTYELLLAERAGTVQAAISETAGQLLGEAFEPRDDALYPGFSLAQYVCVAAGLPVTRPEKLIQLAAEPVNVATEVEAGNIVALQSSDSDSVTMLLAVGAGEERIIYATAQTGWVVMSYIEQMDSAGVFRWANGAGTAQ